MTIYEVKISAEDRDQADIILNSLLDKQLVTGGQFIAAPARFWWKGEIVDMAEYLTITSYTVEGNQNPIIDDVRRTSQEEVPMITFVAVDGINRELHDWVTDTLAAHEDVDADGFDNSDIGADGLNNTGHRMGTTSSDDDATDDDHPSDQAFKITLS